MGKVNAMKRTSWFKHSLAAISGTAAMALAGLLTSASAQITPGGISMQPANSALAEEVHFFHNWVLMPIITVISLFVLALLIWIVVRYNQRANPTPRKFSHNTLIEVVWTVVPIVILLFISIFSFDLLYKEDVVPDGKQVVAEADGATTDFVFANDFSERRMVRNAKHLQVFVDDGTTMRLLTRRTDYTVDGMGDATITVTLNEAPRRGELVVIRGGRSLDHRQDVVLAPTVTIKATGYQWNWSYAYPEFGDFEFFSNMLPKEETTPELYLREVDNRFLVPVGETIRIMTTAKDVIHAFALPAFAIKIDAVPGRINETWIRADREGVYYGQCSEICGIKHAFMPIAVEVVSRARFEEWIDEQRTLAGMEPMFDVADAEAPQKLAALETATTIEKTNLSATPAGAQN